MSTTRSSGAACTTGSTIRRSPPRSRSCGARCRRSPPSCAAATVDGPEAISYIADGPGALDAAAVDATLGLLLKYHDDIERVRGSRVAELLAAAGARPR